MRPVFIFIALIVAVAAGVLFWMVNSKKDDAEALVVQPKASAVAVDVTSIVVARQDIPVGKRITEEDIDRQPWPKHLVLEDFVQVGNETGLIDMVARTPFKAREPLALSRLANPNDPGFLAAQLPKGMRATTISVDAISGVGGFIFPGDRVDVLIRHNVSIEEDYRDATDTQGQIVAEGVPPEKPERVRKLPLENAYKIPILMDPTKRSNRPLLPVTEVLILNAKVLAVGRQPAQYENSTEQPVPNNVTLMVSEREAEKLRHAEPGALSLSLRALEDGNDRGLPRPISDADMTSLTPPSYFPYLYGEGNYTSQVMELENVDYSSDVDEKKDENTDANANIITIIRGTTDKKQPVGAK